MTRLAPDAMVVDTVWSPEQLAQYQLRIAQLAAYGFYHEYVVRDQSGQVLRTPGNHPCIGVLPNLDAFGYPKDLRGKSLLDFGCNAGFFSCVAKLRGAESVLGVDYYPHCIEQGRLMREILQLDIEFRQGDGETIANEVPAHDVVINTGVMYHLQNPMAFLTNMARLTREFMFLESETLIDRKYSDYAWFIEREYLRDVSNWWIYGPDCLVKMARAAGFSRVEFKGFVWKPSRSERKTPEGFERQGRGVYHCWK